MSCDSELDALNQEIRDLKTEVEDLRYDLNRVISTINALYI